MLPDYQLAWMRQQALQTMPGTAIISALVRTSDGAGGWSEVPVPVTGGTVPYRLDPVYARMAEVIAEKEAIVEMRKLTLPYNAPILPDRQITCGTEIYEVRTLSEDHSWNVTRWAHVAKVK